MDINSDMGELNHLLADGTYEKLMSHVTSINLACGGHAGDEEMMAAMVVMAKDKGIKIGAHPSYPDKENFGREEMEDIDPNELLDSIRDQIEKLVDISSEHEMELTHVKPHGALYNLAVNNEEISQTIAEAIIDVDSSYKAVGLAGSKMLTVFDALGLDTISEGYVDRVYEADGTLRSRKFEDALITDPQRAAEQMKEMLNGNIIAVDGSSIPINITSVCVHSDTPNAVDIAQAVKAQIQ
ncbi:MAG: 5-oxoprolinase subunit PxpA [Candidatus Neomarinimicrobiota bacterium]|nr:5-oxoprolinase subunit PxpA [Candidatus Neomarinimicrobiota bacterium]